MRNRWTLALFVLVAALHVAPVWSVRYLPTGDGATHVYNAWILHGLVTGQAPPNVERACRIDWRPFPNWTGHALMALAMTVVPPLVAEKLLVTLILALFFAGAWSLATAVDPRSGVHAFFVFPFAYAQTLMAGYYNFSLSVGLFLIVVATWWRRRDRPPGGTIAILAALLVICYFTHPMAALLACGAIALLALMERRPWHLLAIVPVAPLLLLFGSAEQSNVGQALDLHVAWDAARILGTGEVIQSLDAGRQRPFSIALVLLMAILAIVTIARDRRRPANALAVLTLALAAMMFWVPGPRGMRDLFTGRMSLFLFPLLAAWLTPRITGRWRIALAGGLSLLAVGNLAIVWRHVRAAGADTAAWVRGFEAVEAETTLLPLLFTRPNAGTVVDLFVHRLSYAALERRLVDYSNYESATGYFPIVWRDARIDTSRIERAPGSVDIARYAPLAQHVVTAGLLFYTPQAREIQRHYVLTGIRGELRIYRRKAPLRGAFEAILLPLLGTRTDLGAPSGARWRIDQRITNGGQSPLRVVFATCLEDIPCDFQLGPGEMIPISSAERRFALLRVPQGASSQLRIDTVVRRADVDRPDLSIAIPSAHERTFGRGSIRIENVPAHGRKVGVRVYALSGETWNAGTVRLRSRKTGALLGEQRFATDSFFENASLDAAGAAAIDIEVSVAPETRVWAFATSADGSGRTHVHLPGPGR